MQSTFSQHPHDPDYQPKPQSRFPLSALIWLPLSLAFAAGIVYAAKFGYERATMELDSLPEAGADNETRSEPFVLDPGDDPLVLAPDESAFRDELSAPPGSAGSTALLVTKPVRLRIVDRDAEFARVLVIDGEHAGQRYWTRAARLDAAKRAAQ